MKPSHLIFLHGFLGRDSFWYPMKRAVQTAFPNWAMTLLSLPGHRDSKFFFESAGQPVPPFSTATDWVASHAVSKKNNWLVGYSMGARLALGTLLTHSDRFQGAVLYSVHPGITDAPERAQRQQWEHSLKARLASHSIAPPAMAPLVDYFETLPVFDSQRTLPAEVLAAQRETRLSHHPESILRCIDLLGLGNTPDMSDAMAQTAKPILLVTGALDEKYSDIAKASQKQNHLLTHRVIPGAGHNTILESPEESAAQLIAFVKEYGGN